MANIKYKNSFRIKSIRLQSWNYTENGSYFITVCSKKRKCFLGNISNEKMVLSPMGEIVEKYWYEIPHHFPFIKLGAFTIMPNHIHGIISIRKNRE